MECSLVVSDDFTDRWVNQVWICSCNWEIILEHIHEQMFYTVEVVTGLFYYNYNLNYNVL